MYSRYVRLVESGRSCMMDDFKDSCMVLYPFVCTFCGDIKEPFLSSILSMLHSPTSTTRIVYPPSFVFLVVDAMYHYLLKVDTTLFIQHLLTLTDSQVGTRISRRRHRIVRSRLQKLHGVKCVRQVTPKGGL